MSRLQEIFSQVKLPETPRILIARLSALGDVIQTLSVLGLIRQIYPNAVIGWLIETDAAMLVENHSQIQHVHVFHRKRWSKQFKQPGQWSQTANEITAFYQDIKRLRYDVVIDFQGLLKSALACYFTGIKTRIGFQDSREGATYFYTQTVKMDYNFFDQSIPIYRSYRKLIETLIPSDSSVYLPDYLPATLPEVASEIALAIQQRLGAFSNPEAPLLVIAPGTQWNSKLWPTTYWRKLLEQIRDETDFNVLCVGAPSDRPTTQAVMLDFTGNTEFSPGRCQDWTGETSILQLIALFQKADWVIGSDSAPIHIAGASGFPKVIGIYGPTGYLRTFPPGHQEKIMLLSATPTLSCQPCDKSVCPFGTKACLDEVSPMSVLNVLTGQITLAG